MELVFVSAKTRADLLAPAVYAAVAQMERGDEVLAAEIDPAFADGESMRREYGVDYDAELNCLAVCGVRGERKVYAALVVPYGRKANMNGALKRVLDVKKAGLADLDEVIALTGMEYGSITPVGLPAGWKLVIDPVVFKQDTVIVGAGKANGKLRLPAAVLKELPDVIILEGLAKEIKA